MKKPVIIFIPGFKGSFLRQRNNDRLVWPSPWQIYFGNKSLQLPIQQNDETLLELYSSEVLHKITLVPGIFEIKFYDYWLKTLKQNFGKTHEIIGFDYDWRQDNFEAVQKLDQLIKRLNQPSPSNPGGTRDISLIAHSMGGLIASYYLRYGNQDFELAQENWSGAEQVDHMIFAGVPFRGTASMFRSIQIGMRTEQNRKLLCQPAVASFPSSYQLMPMAGSSFLSKLDGTPLEQDIFNGQHWQENHWGLMSDKNVQDAIDEQKVNRTFTDNQLTRASQFMERIHKPMRREVPKAPDVLNVIGQGYDTPERIYVDQDENGCWSILSSQDAKQHPEIPDPHCIYGDGDYNVTASSAQLPESFTTFKHQTIYSDHEHSALYDDPTIQQQIIDLIRHSG
ncbi:MAG: hypothetical protein KUG72_02700 [Pseudomonadales bacterium]|nr:hypothetical protein [Pseudomonadales bacterium]